MAKSKTCPNCSSRSILRQAQDERLDFPLVVSQSKHALRSNRLGLLGFHRCSSIGFYFILFIRIIAVQFIDYRIGKLANDEAPSFLVKLRPAQRVLGN